MTGRRPLSPVPAAAWVVLALVAGACSRDSATTGPSHGVGKDFAANLRAVSGDQQLGRLGVALAQPITVKVVDAGGQPVAGATVTFGVRAGGGSVNPAANVSDANGLVASVWTMGGTLGAAKVVAMLTNSFVLDSATFTATARPGLPNSFAKVSGDSQTSKAGKKAALPLVVKLQDAYGNGVPGEKITWTAVAPNGTVTFAVDTTVADGSAAANWTLGATTSRQSVSAAAANASSLGSITFNATATGIPSDFAKVSGDTQVTNAGRKLPLPVVVRVRDEFGNGASGVKVVWTPIQADAQVSFLVDTTAADGSATASWILGKSAGSQSLTVAGTGLTSLAFTARATADTGRVLTISGGTAQTAAAGSALATQLKVTLTDQYGNPVQNDLIVWNDSVAGGGTVNPQQIATNAQGQATATWTLGGNAGPQFLRAKNGNAVKVNFTATATLAFGEVVAGNAQACAVAVSNQRVYCWGTGDAGQLGKGVFKNIAAPSTPVATAADSVNGPFLSVRLLTGGRNSFCALSVARQLFCWGRVVGQAGSTTNVATLNSIVDPRQQILPNWLATGEEHYCVLDLAGLGFCTGTDFAGQLGNGSFTSPAVGTYPFIAPGTQSYSYLAAGKQHTCGFRQYNPLLGANNLVPECWGLNNTGQVGNATLTFASVNTPAFINLPVGSPTAFDSTSLALGGLHTCVLSLLPTPGLGYCWGSNGYGQLGRGTTLTSTARDSVLRAVSMPGAVTFSKIYAGEYHTCAISTTGAAYCWGRNDYGELGNGTTTTSTAPVAVAGGLAFRSLTVGEFFTCGVANAGVAAPPGSPPISAGTVYCWGDNSFGQLGQNTTGNSSLASTPTKVLYQP